MVRVAQPADQVVLGPAGVNDDDRGRRANARVNDLVVPGVQFAPGRQRFRFLRVLQRIVDDDEIRGLAGAGTAAADERHPAAARRSEEHTSELQSLMRSSYAVFCLKKKN